MRLPGLEIEARPNCWPSFCKAFPPLNRQLGNSRAITLSRVSLRASSRNA
jgi:hypothetical protein